MGGKNEEVREKFKYNNSDNISLKYFKYKNQLSDIFNGNF